MQAYPCNKSITGEGTLGFFLHGWVANFGPPTLLIADADVRWKHPKGVFQAALGGLGAVVRLGAPYLKTAASPAERAHLRLLEGSRCAMSATQSPDWVPVLPGVVVGINTCYCPSRAETPHYLFLGSPGFGGYGGKTTGKEELLGSLGGGYASTYTAAVRAARDGVLALRNKRMDHKLAHQERLASGAARPHPP